MKRNSIYHGDCLDLMHGIPDGSIDMILADLPYGQTACHWDSIIPLEPLWAHYKRIIKPRGAIVLTASQPFTSMLVMSNLEWFKYEWVWEKNTGTRFLDAKKRPLNFHENILVFYRDQPIYNPQKVKGRKNHSRVPGKYKKGSSIYRPIESPVSDETGWKYPKTVQGFNTVPPSLIIHPTEKPVELFSYLIKTYTNPGDLVLDNCIGSGTTAIAAIETGRDWIGIEKDEGYFEIAKARIEERLKQPFLPGLVEAQPEKPEQPQLFNVAQHVANVTPETPAA